MVKIKLDGGKTLKVIILAGGFGTRISQYTQNIPKPMIQINDVPIIEHIIRYYVNFSHKDFYLALGFKAEVIKEYFLNYPALKSDICVDLKSGKVTKFLQAELDCRVNLIDTGLNTMTGGRLKRLQKYIGNETFMFTYGDGLADVDLDQLIAFHKSHGKIATCTAVRPIARFGEIIVEQETVSSFQEKPQTQDGWINGGYFVAEPEIFDFIEDDATILEREPLEKLAQSGELNAYRHTGFWQCMDTKRDMDYLNSLVKAGEAPWIV